MVAFKLDENNKEFNAAFDFINSKDELLFLTGKAGTGKSTFLRYLKNKTNKNTIVLAPTGVAAINAGGNTINSFFQIPFSPFIPRDKRLRIHIPSGDSDKTSIFNTFKYRREKREIIENLDLLIIDEVSMVRCDIIDVIDKILKAFRNSSAPFGGVQVLLIGDPFQLSPVVKDDDWDILKRDYDTGFFFSSHVLKDHLPNYIELQKIYRQKDIKFISLLNKVRTNEVTDNDIKFLNSKYEPRFSPSQKDNFIILASKNRQVDNINAKKLNELTTRSKTYKGELSGEFPKSRGKYVLPTAMKLDLKVGAQVMFLVNDTGINKRYFNGKIVKIKALYEDEIEVITVEGNSIMVQPHTWRNVQYSWNAKKQRVEEKEKGRFTQFPIRLAWAITVHKSQGLTFDQVYADVANAFAPGQVYVALSRCRSMEGLKLKSRIPRSAIRTEAKVVSFMDKCKSHIPSNIIKDIPKNISKQVTPSTTEKVVSIDGIWDNKPVLPNKIRVGKSTSNNWSSSDNKYLKLFENDDKKLENDKQLENLKQELKQMKSKMENLSRELDIERGKLYKTEQLYNKEKQKQIQLLDIIKLLKNKLKKTPSEQPTNWLFFITKQHHHNLQKITTQLVNSRKEITELWNENQELAKQNIALTNNQNKPNLIKWFYSFLS